MLCCVFVSCLCRVQHVVFLCCVIVCCIVFLVAHCFVLSDMFRALVGCVSICICIVVCHCVVLQCGVYLDALFLFMVMLFIVILFVFFFIFGSRIVSVLVCHVLFVLSC